MNHLRRTLRAAEATSLRLRAHVREGFTLIETLAAITLLIVAIVSPMLLTERSLASAYYARDQITAYYLAQEAIEAIRQIRDDNILKIAHYTGPLTSSPNLFDGINSVSPSCNGPQQYFTVDATQTNINPTPCPTPSDPTSCPNLQTSGGLYGYGANWSNTYFKRVAYACYTDSSQDEVFLSVTVSWQTGALAARSFTMTEDLYRWVQDGSGS